MNKSLNIAYDQEETKHIVAMLELSQELKKQEIKIEEFLKTL